MPHREARSIEATPSVERRPRILAVDDEAVNRSLLTRMLSPHYDVVEAEDGPSALAALRQPEGFDLVLLDVMMPDMSGFDACRAIKASHQDSFLPVVLLTALDSQNDRNEGLAAGADDFLTKPVDRRELELRCRALLRLRRSELTVKAQMQDLAEMQALKDDLVSLVVHDLRNPLSSLMSTIELVRDELRQDPREQLKADVNAAFEGALRLRQLVEEVLQVRLLEEKQLVLRRDIVRLSEVAAEAIGSLEGAARSREIALELRPHQDPPVSIDQQLVRRCIENLIANAVKYSPRGGSIDVSCAAAGPLVHVDVADRGPGVPDDAKSAVFEKFGSVEAKRKQAPRGFGLGLYLVSLVASAHGGGASVYDRPGGGAIFRIVLPARAG